MSNAINEANNYLFKYARVEFDVNYLERRLAAPHIPQQSLQKLAAKIEKNLNRIATQLEDRVFLKIKNGIQLFAMSSLAREHTNELKAIFERKVDISKLKGQLQRLQNAVKLRLSQ